MASLIISNEYANFYILILYMYNFFILKNKNLINNTHYSCTYYCITPQKKSDDRVANSCISLFCIN